MKKEAICKKGLLIIALLFMTGAAALADNPIFTYSFAADPSARVFNGRVYLYPSHDKFDSDWWTMTDWHVYSSIDLENWTDHGVMLYLSDISWAAESAWAPDCIERNGKYYFYFPTDQDYIGVAVSNAPHGPFNDALGHPLINRQTPGIQAPRDLIDPAVFIDDDGQAYLFFSQNVVNAVRLNSDMISLQGNVQIVQGADNFFEALWVHKYNGLYYLSYSGNSRILYATSANPMGPYTYRGEILAPVSSGTNHHSILEFSGQWYIFYHDSDISGVQYHRSVNIEYLYYNSDGTIRTVPQTNQGVEPVPPPGSNTWNKVDDTSSSITYTGTWGSYTGNPGYQGTEKFSETTGSGAALSFNGTRGRVYGYKRDDLGYADVYIDGGYVTTFNCYSNNSFYDEVLYETDNLAAGTHTLEIVVKGKKDPESSGTEIIIDAFASLDDGILQVCPTGDVNEDGQVTIVDALMIAQYYVGLNPQGYNASEGDVNNDGELNIIDALVVAQLYVGLIAEIPCPY